MREKIVKKLLQNTCSNIISHFHKSFYVIFFKRNASNTPSNTHFSTHSLWLVKIHMGPTKSCGSHINLVGRIWILTNQRECIEKCVLEGVLLAFLIFQLRAIKVNTPIFNWIKCNKNFTDFGEPCLIYMCWYP